MKVLQILPSEIPSETGECVPMFAFRETTDSSTSRSPRSLALSARSTVAELELAIPPQLLRKGKWSPEEEQYTLKVMELFKEGVVDSTPGISLRIYLAKKLNCEPMRITKKYAGSYAVGKIVFLPQHGKLASSTALQEQMKVLTRLEEKFVTTLNQYAMMESAINMTKKSSKRKPATAELVNGKKQKPDLVQVDLETDPGVVAFPGDDVSPRMMSDECKGTEPEDEPKDPVSFQSSRSQSSQSQGKGRAWQSYLFKVSPK